MRRIRRVCYTNGMTQTGETPQEFDIVTEARTGIRWVVLAVGTDRVELVRRGELGKVYGSLRTDEVTVTR